MSSRSEDRMEMIVKVISDLLNINEINTRDNVIKTETGRAILNKNQMVLHDQATSNIYEILMELPKSITKDNWTIEDITRIYNSKVYSHIDETNHVSFSHFDAKKKSIVRKRRRKLNELLREDRRSRERSAILYNKIEKNES